MMKFMQLDIEADQDEEGGIMELHDHKNDLARIGKNWGKIHIDQLISAHDTQENSG